MTFIDRDRYELVPFPQSLLDARNGLRASMSFEKTQMRLKPPESQPWMQNVVVYVQKSASEELWSVSVVSHDGRYFSAFSPP